MTARPPSSERHKPAWSPREDGATALRDLAHELNSHLDGSIRTLGLAQRALDTAGGPPALDDVASKLRTARQAMQGMARVLDRAMGGTAGEAEREMQTIGATIDEVTGVLAALAEEHDVHLASCIAAEAARIPAGPLGAVIQNGLSNAIQACSDVSRDDRWVEVRVETTADGDVAIYIADTGQGLPADFAIGRSGRHDGHGIGLDASRRIVEGLGGRMRLVRVPYGRGTVFQVKVPAARLNQS